MLQYAEQPTDGANGQNAHFPVKNDIAHAVTGLYAQCVPDGLGSVVCPFFVTVDSSMGASPFALQCTQSPYLLQ